MTTIRTARPGLLLCEDGLWLFKSEYDHTTPGASLSSDNYPMVFNMAGEFVGREFMDRPCREIDPDAIALPPPKTAAAEALVPLVRDMLVGAFTRAGEAHEQRRARAIVQAIIALIDERTLSTESGRR